MRVFSSRTHGVLDYVVSILFIASPWLLDFDRNGAETWTPVMIGIGSIIMSLFTDYELGALRKIPLSVHLNIDLAAGSFLALSPWIFGFDNYVYIPHLVMGLFEVSASMLTERSPRYKLRTTH